MRKGGMGGEEGVAGIRRIGKNRSAFLLIRNHTSQCRLMKWKRDKYYLEKNDVMFFLISENEYICNLKTRISTLL